MVTGQLRLTPYDTTSVRSTFSCLSQNTMFKPFSPTMPQWKQQYENRSSCAQVGQLNEQLKTLEAEQAELAKFQAADKQRRSIEYTIYDKEIAHTRDKLAQVR